MQFIIESICWLSAAISLLTTGCQQPSPIENCCFGPCQHNRDHISQSVWTKVAQSIYRHKISDEFDNEQSRPSNTEVICPKLLKIAVLYLVSSIETTFLNQSGPKLHKVFIGTRSRMSSIMSKICPVTTKLFALELLEIVVYVCIFTICYCSSPYIY